MKLLAIALVVGCSSAADIAHVRFEGLHEVSEAQLRDVPHQDRLWVLARLYDLGYPEAKVDVSQHGQDVTFHVEEGHRFRLRSAKLHERGSDAAKTSLHRTTVGDWFCRGDVVRDLEDAHAVYASLGHRDAKMTPTMMLDESARAMDLDIVIDP